MEAREAGGGEVGLLSANSTLKAIDCTARFGKLNFNWGFFDNEFWIYINRFFIKG